jgi:hypothetical protein
MVREDDRVVGRVRRPSPVALVLPRVRNSAARSGRPRSGFVIRAARGGWTLVDLALCRVEWG